MRTKKDTRSQNPKIDKEEASPQHVVSTHRHVDRTPHTNQIKAPIFGQLLDDNSENKSVSEMNPSPKNKPNNSSFNIFTDNVLQNKVDELENSNHFRKVKKYQKRSQSKNQRLIEELAQTNRIQKSIEGGLKYTQENSKVATLAKLSEQL